MSRRDAEIALSSENVDAICDALVRVALQDPDWEWIEAQCLKAGQHEDWRVRAVVATCLGHVARIHGKLHVDQVMRLLVELRNDPRTGGRAEDALDDIRVFMDA